MTLPRGIGAFAMSLLLLAAAAVCLARPASAAEPPEALVQGFYEGNGQDAAGPFKIEARLVAEGKGTYWMLVRQFRGEDKVSRAELTGKAGTDAVALSGRAGEVDWKAGWTQGTVKGSIGPQGSFELHRVERKPATLGKKPPSGAIVLLDGKDFSEMTPGRDASWDSIKADDDGSIQVPKGGMRSKQAWEGSFDLHVEFLIPLRPSAHSQGRGNSGVYLPNGDEIQVLDSFGDTTYLGGGCGGVYAYKDPDTMEIIDSLQEQPNHKYNLSSLPPLEWQTYDIEYRVEKKDGKPDGKPRVTVYQNGVKIHDRFEVRAKARKGGFFFQDHGNPVRYRNIWVLPVDKG